MADQAKNCKISVASRFLGESLTVGRVKCSISSDKIQIVQEKVFILKTRQEVRLSFEKLQQNYHWDFYSKLLCRRCLFGNSFSKTWTPCSRQNDCQKCLRWYSQNVDINLLKCWTMRRIYKHQKHLVIEDELSKITYPSLKWKPLNIRESRFMQKIKNWSHYEPQWGDYNKPNTSLYAQIFPLLKNQERKLKKMT